MNVGERIKERRQYLGMSVDELADKLGKNRATIYRYESAEIENLPLNILEPLAKALDVTPSYLMGWDKATSAAKKIPLLVRHHCSRCPIASRGTHRGLFQYRLIHQS